SPARKRKSSCPRTPDAAHRDRDVVHRGPESAALCLRRGLRRAETVFELALDLLDFALIGLELQRAVPLEARFEPAAAAPIGIAQMIVDRRVFRNHLDRTLQLLDRLAVIAETEIRPPETVDDVAVRRPQRDRAFDHLQPLVKMRSLIDPGIAEIVEHERLLRLERQRLTKIGFGAGPLMRALQRDAAAVIETPVARAVLADARQRVIIGDHRLAEAVVTAENVAELDCRLAIPRPLARHFAQQRNRFVGPADLVESRCLAQPGRP